MGCGCGCPGAVGSPCPGVDTGQDPLRARVRAHVARLVGPTIGTVAGKHTISEIRDLMATVDFRIKATFALIAKINGAQGAFTPGHPGISSNAIAAWNVWLTHWREVQDKVATVLVALRVSDPLVPADFQPAEDQWLRLMCAINRSCDDTHADPGDMSNVIGQIEEEAGERIDESERPTPTAGDPDFGAFLKVDAAIKAGEKAAASSSGVIAAVAIVGVALGGIYLLSAYWGTHALRG